MPTQNSEPFWRQHVDAWRTSGLTQKQYSARHGLSAMTLAKWSSELQRRKRGVSPRQALVPIRVASESASRPPITVERGALRMTVPVGTDPRWLAALLREMAAC